MSTKSATLAKSLHTVSVLVNVARLAGAATGNTQKRDPAACVRCALIALGYDGAADPHGLAAKAVAQLSRESAQ